MINNNNQKLLRIKKEEQKMDKKFSKEANILYVDDNPMNLKSFEIELKKFYNIFLAESATEGLDILKRNKIQVLVTDQRMPEMTGIELLEKVSEKYLETMRIILTAYDDSEAVIDAINKGRVHSYLLKSVDMAEVKNAIKNALDTYSLREENKKLMTELTRKNEALRNRTSGLEKKISKRRRVEEAMIKHQEQLEDLVKERTKELESKNEQLTKEIAERRQTEKELKQSEERYSLAERASGIGSWDRNIKTGDLQWSDTVEPLFGFKKGGFGKTYEAFSKVVHPGDRQIVIDSVNACIEEGKEYKIEHRIVCPDGSIKWVLETGDAIRDEYGNATRMLGVVMDITQRKQATEELEKAREAADAANRAKSEFLANMSHEIRTPMNAVIGYADLLTQLVSDETQRNYLNSIKTSGRSLMKLIDDILDLSKIEAGKLELQFEFVDTYSFFEEMEHIFSFKITEKGLDFNVNITSGTPCGLYIDEIRVRQILLNLLGNAIKFTEKGHIKLSVCTENPQMVEYRKNKIEEYVDLIIEVEDTGIGISGESGKAIFKSFQQQEGQSTKKYGGTGLGLAITKRLVELMNGTISVTSELNKGSTFKIVIPDVAYIRDFEQIDQDLFIDTGTVIFDEATLLVVDDVEHNRKILIDTLNGTALKVFEAENGEQAYNLAREIIPDIIIVDIRMPVMDGFEFLKLIKNDKKLKHIPVIAYSASVMKSQKEKISHSDFTGFLIKPVQITELYIELMNNLSYQTIKTDRSPETGLPEKDLSTSAIENLSTIIEILETELKDKWETFSKKQPLNEVKEFGKKIIALGENNSAKIITDYGKNLVNATEAFDINTILHLLKRYPKLIKKIKGYIKSK